jgi:hypothetical protein
MFIIFWLFDLILLIINNIYWHGLPLIIASLFINSFYINYIFILPNIIFILSPSLFLVHASYLIHLFFIYNHSTYAIIDYNIFIITIVLPLSNN